MAKNTATEFRWQMNLKILLFAFMFFPILIALSVWQISRAEEKQQMLDAQQARIALPAVSPEELDLTQPQNYRPLEVTGQWSGTYFLLENRVRQSRPGYEVIGLFRSGEINVLVNRGWVEASYDRQRLPELEFETGTLSLNGYAYRSDSVPFTLGDPVWTGSWPERIQALDWELLSERIGASIFPYALRLDPDSTSALTTGWTIVNIPPEKHIGYAVQWAALAAALVILTLFANSNMGAWIKSKLRKDYE